ncbi:hypothetical protein J2Y69_003206 [Microbacterium resistens]|uniref:Restriction endonuclease n=1 Tax=Microbacterium resistens TaxID=156977 RepID=A0ABU1SG38_9MICO|nr:BsuBI/PstI family type II restriction endonuclease [Microbacterium resistens]MDR6868587.1 hypothetical protein [Microbacterium resistens]
MTIYLPIVPVDEAVKRLELIFPRAAFDSVLSSPLAAASVTAMIYVGAVWDDDLEASGQRWIRPSMVMWLNDTELEYTGIQERDAWYTAALVGKKATAKLASTRGYSMAQRYADNTRETLRDETWPKWREHGATLFRGGMPTSFPGPRWTLTRSFAALFDPTLEGDALTSAIEAWVQTNMSTAGRMKAMSARDLARSEDAVDVVLPNGTHRQLEAGGASQILKGVIEAWAPARLSSPMVLSISEPGDKVYLIDNERLASIGISIDISKLLPDALLVDVGVNPVEFWMIEAVQTDGEISDARKADLLEWATAQGINPDHCQFLTAFSSRNSAPARRRLKDLAEGTYAWFLDEPGMELAWAPIERGADAPPRLAPVTPLR